MTKVEVNPKLLVWASDRSTLGRAELEGRFPKLARWIAGTDTPTLNQLELFSKATAAPLGYLFLQTPPVEAMNIPHYRTLTDKAVGAPSTELLDTLHTMERRQDWLRDFLVAEGRERVPLVRCARTDERPRGVAERIGTLLKLSPDWATEQRTWEETLATLRHAMTAAGVVVVINGVVGNDACRKLDVEEFRGFVLVDDLAPLVFVNGADSKSAQMFTLAHELAHLAFGASAAFDLRRLEPATDATERACNQVAAEFLVPEAMLRQVWKPEDADPYGTVSRALKVSRIVAGRRLLDLGFITRERFSSFYQRTTAQEQWKKNAADPGGNFNATTLQRVGARFAVELIRAYQEGRVLPTEAYRLTDLKRKSFDELVRRANEGGLE